jgi:hypothetical protein
MLKLMEHCNCLDDTNFVNVLPNRAHNNSMELLEKIKALKLESALCVADGKVAQFFIALIN